MATLQFEPMSVALRRDETAALTLIRLAGADKLTTAYETPGQYVAIAIDGIEKPGYMAIASRPGVDYFEFLVAPGGAVADALREVAPGATVGVSAPMGSGYPLAAAKGRDLWLVGAGSGVAALRPVVETVARARADHGRVVLLLGVRGRDDLPFDGEIDGWRESGIEVVLTASRAGDDATWDGEHGYVQDVLAKKVESLEGAVLFACGMKDMLDTLRTVSAELGLAAERFHTNY